MKFNQDFIEQVREANNLVDIIGQYTDLKGRGHQFMGLCPFPDHSEKSPSFSVSENKQVYHCFGCKKSGNAYTFLQSYSGLSFTDAVEFLARRANIPMPEFVEDNKEKSSKTTLLRINKFAASFLHRQLKALPSNHAARQYLNQRGIDEETIDEMKLGYAGDEWSDLYYFFKDKNVPLEEAEKLGLIKPKKNSGYFDLFHHRLLFPIFSTQEDVVGFGGRVIDKEQKPKYLNSPESPVFHKGRTFYGLNFAAKHIRQADRVVIVEGYMDQIALYRAGIKNVVATLGTALTEDHAYLIQKHTSQVVLMFDGDFAGMNAAERSLLPMFAQGLCPLAVFLPDSLDPDDYVKKHGAPALQEKIDQAQELFILIISDWLKDSKFSANEKIQFMEKVKPYLNAISDRGLKDLYVKTVAQRLLVDEKWVVRELHVETSARPAPVAKIEKPVACEEEAPYEVEQWRLKGSQRDELYLMGMVLNSPELLTKVIESGVHMKVSSESVKKLLSLVIQRYGQNPSDFDKLTPLVFSRIQDPEELTGLFKFWSLDGAEDEALKTTTSCIKRIEARHLKLQSQIIAGQLRNGQQGDSLEKLEQIMNIHKNRIQLNRPVKGEP